MRLMVSQSQGVWREDAISESSFLQSIQQLPEQEQNNGKDFLELLQMGITDVVLVREGYHKQQSIALNAQQPEQHRVPVCDLPAPVELQWQLASNMLDILGQLSRELFGDDRWSKTRFQHHISSKEVAAFNGYQKGIEFELTERCKLLEVHYIRKTYQHQTTTQDANPFAQHLTAEQAAQQQGHVLSVRLTLQRMGHSQPVTVDQPAQVEVCNQQQQPCDQKPRSNLHPYGVQQAVTKAYICSLEYPLFQLDSSDYIIPAKLFEKGMEQWSSLMPRDPFTMLWDGTPYFGCALEFRQRALDDPFHGSPWRSIAVDWEDQAVDRENDPEDWCYGNPWEMIRPEGYVPRAVPGACSQPAFSFSCAQAATVAAQTYAPWTAYGAAAAAAAMKFASSKRRRQRRSRKSDHLSDDYENYTTLDSDMFYYDDDPEEFMIDDDSTLRRKRPKQQQRAGRGTARSSSRVAAVSAISFAKRCNAAAETADATEPKHNFGREMLGVPEGVCLVCRRSDGDLVTGHLGKASQSCSRYYHVGCLLLLNALGVRCIGQSKQQQQQQQQPPSEEELASVQCDGLLQQLRQLQQEQRDQLGPAAAAAVAEATEAAALHQQNYFSVCCPAHYCHGCGLNGKHEHMVWCCCCLIRVYHNRNCIPPGSETVEVNGRDYIKCPVCVAATVPSPGSPEQQPAAVTAAAPKRQAEGESQLASATARGRQQRRRAAKSDGTHQQQVPISTRDDSAGVQVQQVQEMDDVSVQEMQQGAQPDTAPPVQTAAVLDTNCHADPALLAPKAQLLGEAEDQTDGAVSGGNAAAEDDEGDDDVVFVTETKAASGAPSAATADYGSSRHPSPVVALSEQQLQQLEQDYQAVVALQEQYEQHRNLHQAQETKEAAAASEEQAELPDPAVGRSTRSRGRQNSMPQADAGDVMASSSHHSSDALNALMPAWLKFSLNDSERLRPSYRLVALADGTDSDSASAAAAALRHVAAAATRMPHYVDKLPGSATHLDLVSPQSHWLIGSAEKAESAKFKVTGSWTGCPVLDIPTPDDGVFGLCLAVDHFGLLDKQQEQQKQQSVQVKGHGRVSASGAARRGRSAATGAQEICESAAAGSGDVVRRPGVYLRCWRPVMQCKLEKQQQLLHLQQLGDEKGGSAYQVLVNDVPFPEKLGRQDMQLHPGDVLVVQGRRFKLTTAAQH